MMKASKELADFIRVRRERRGSQSLAARTVGCSQGVWTRWEKGVLPQNPIYRQGIADYLEVSLDELLAKAGLDLAQNPNSQTQNLLPLIKMIALCDLDVLSMQDIRFLLVTQTSLGQPMSSSLIAELMKHRKAIKETK